MKAEGAARQQQKQKQKVVPKIAPPMSPEGSSSSQENQQLDGQVAEEQKAAGEQQQQQLEEQVGPSGAGKKNGTLVIRTSAPTQLEGKIQQEAIGVAEAASTVGLNPEAAVSKAVRTIVGVEEVGTVAAVEAAGTVALGAEAGGSAVNLQKHRTVLGIPPSTVRDSTRQSSPVIVDTSCSTSEGPPSLRGAGTAAIEVFPGSQSPMAGSSETKAVSHGSAAAGTSGANSAAPLSPAANVGGVDPSSLSMGSSGPAAAAGSKPRRAKRVECVVCLDARAEVMLLPCKHTILCQTCAELVREGGKTCPMCRTAVEGEVMMGGMGVEGRGWNGPAVAAAGGTAQQEVVTGESVVAEVHHLPLKQQQEGGSGDCENAASSCTSARPCLPDVSGSSLLSSSSSSTTEAVASTSGASFASGSIALPGVLQQLLASQPSSSSSNLSSDGVRQQQQQFQAALPGTMAVSQRLVANQASGSVAAPLSCMSPGNSITPAVFLGQKRAITSVLGVPTAVTSPARSTALLLMPGLAGSDAAGSQSSLHAIAPAACPSPPTPKDGSYGRESAAAVGPAANVMASTITGQEQQQACRAFMGEAASLLRQTEAEAFSLLAQTQVQLTEMMQKHRSRMRELCALYGVAEEDVV